ncbi:MAG: tRNA 2-selenouridine(34) synthase MnmH [Thalassobium sp.]|nr:MAG: tRNA 2-selenouridine(34) synthase MnmH [Oceanospirillales bacterium]PHQ88051.1 MAG: tRNA 2-selenouridine(34) synthase MnmH [Thalassobium sp.]
MSRPDTNDFSAIFLRDTPMMDTRAPLEYAKGAFPHAVSLPLMTDAERAKVGTCYKQQGQDEAIKLGHELVSGAVKEARVQKWLAFAAANPDGYLYCFRGGLRSQITQRWLAEAGCEYPRITGGYKAMRRFLINTLERVVDQRSAIILSGRTGCAKTDLLNTLPNSIDLEGLAHHRGSTFGKRPAGQPSQIDFENNLAIQLLRKDHDLAGNDSASIILEDESLLIGRCALPAVLRARMEGSGVVVVDAELEDRVEHSFNNYILHKLGEWQAQEGEELGFAGFAADLRDSMQRVRKRLGGVRHAEISAILEAAIAAHEAGDNSQHRDWICPMLELYYDPMYDYQLNKKAERIVFRGSANEVRDYLLNNSGSR